MKFKRTILGRILGALKIEATSDCGNCYIFYRKYSEHMRWMCLQISAVFDDGTIADIDGRIWRIQSKNVSFNVGDNLHGYLSIFWGDLSMITANFANKEFHLVSPIAR